MSQRLVPMGERLCAPVQVSRARGNGCRAEAILLQNGQRLVTVLSSSIDGVGFEGTVRHDQEFSHGGGLGKFGWFAAARNRR